MTLADENCVFENGKTTCAEGIFGGLGTDVLKLTSCSLDGVDYVSSDIEIVSRPAC